MQWYIWCQPYQICRMRLRTHTHTQRNSRIVEQNGKTWTLSFAGTLGRVGRGKRPNSLCQLRAAQALDSVTVDDRMYARWVSFISKSLQLGASLHWIVVVSAGLRRTWGGTTSCPLGERIMFAVPHRTTYNYPHLSCAVPIFWRLGFDLVGFQSGVMSFRAQNESEGSCWTCPRTRSPVWRAFRRIPS